MLKIHRGDITKLPHQVDVIVNSAHPSLFPGGGVSGAIHAAAGPELADECLTQRNEFGSDLFPPHNVLTKAYGLNAGWVLHAIVPDISRDPAKPPIGVMRSCYFAALDRISANGHKSVAIPLLGAGIYGWPPELALQCALKVAKRFQELEIILVLQDDIALSAAEEQGLIPKT